MKQIQHTWSPLWLPQSSSPCRQQMQTFTFWLHCFMFLCLHLYTYVHVFWFVLSTVYAWKIKQPGSIQRIDSIDKLKVEGEWWVKAVMPEAGSGFGITACWTLKTHFDRCISSLAVDARWGVDNTHSPKRLRVALAGTTLSKPAIYTNAPGIKLNNDMHEATTISPCPAPDSQLTVFTRNLKSIFCFSQFCDWS